MGRTADRATKYARSVVAGRTVAGRLVRLACKRHLDDIAAARKKNYPYRYDREKAEKAINFFPLLRQTKGRWAKQPMELLPWQCFVVGVLFGWIHKATSLRRYRVAYVEVGKKNGKTCMMAGLGLLLAFFDDEGGAEVYSAASSRKQAMIAWDQAKEMVRISPGLSKRIKRLVGNLHRFDIGAKFEPLSSDYGRTDGIMPHGGILDELHEHRNRGIWDIVTKSSIARAQPLVIGITTAGYDRNTVCWEQREYSLEVLEGRAEDPTWFAYIATIDKGDDWKDEKSWLKANPSFGVTFDEDAFRSEFRKALTTPARENSFKRYNLDIWTRQSVRAIPMEKWRACPQTPPLERLKGRPCFGGLDLASAKDITALTLFFPNLLEPGKDFPKAKKNIHGLYRVLWVPENGSWRENTKLEPLYSQWIDKGFLIATPGNITDYDFVLHEIVELGGILDIREIAYDRWNATHLVTQLIDEGAGMVEFGQGYASMSPAWKEFESIVIDARIAHPHDPVFDYMAENFAVMTNAEGNSKPDRNGSGGRIDGIVAALMATGAWLRHKDEPPPPPPVYNDPNLRPNGILSV